MSSASAGWYPQEDGRQRYWDGERWTEHFAPGVGSVEGVPPQMSQPAFATQTTPALPSTPTPQAAPFGSAGTGQVAAVSAKPWFKKKRFVIPGGIVALIILGNALNGGEDAGTEPAVAAESGVTSTPAAAKPKESSAAPVAKPAAKPAAPKVAGIGTKVRDGKFEFVVKSVKCGITKVGTNEYLEKKAQGQYCAVALTVSNIGDKPQSMFADAQKAYDSKSRELSADSEASIYDDKSQVLWEEINPGNSVSGTVYFDIPKAEKITKLELHDSLFSGGVDVSNS